MYLNISYEQDFNDLMLHLKEKYPKTWKQARKDVKKR